MVIPGCFNPKDVSFTQTLGDITFDSVINPYAKRDTDKFIMTVYKEYDAINN